MINTTLFLEEFRPLEAAQYIDTLRVIMRNRRNRGNRYDFLKYFDFVHFFHSFSLLKLLVHVIQLIFAQNVDPLR